MEFTDANFNTEVIAADVPVLVDFWAPWCGPCRVQGPIVEELATEFAGKAVKIGKMNVDENPETGQKYGIMSIPTIMIFHRGEVVQQLVGLQNKEKLQAAITAVR
jgi:thioredoxin 1